MLDAARCKVGRSRAWRAVRTQLRQPDLLRAVVFAEDDPRGVFGHILRTEVRMDRYMQSAGLEMGVLMVAHGCLGLGCTLAFEGPGFGCLL